MKTIKIKDTYSSVTLANPRAALGPFGRPGESVGAGWTYEVTEVPDTVPPHEVLRLWSGTANCTWLGGGPDSGRYSFRFPELGIGRMILR
jgi:hypothetical protein